MNISRLVVRVYGLLFNSNGEVLVTDEYQLGMPMTKFPGGGLEFGEGPIECLRREIMEEMGVEIVNVEHFYTTDFFQQAQFFSEAQLLSIYYTANIKDEKGFIASTVPFDFELGTDGKQSFRWVDTKELNAEMFTFPIDKVVIEKLKFQHNTK